MILLIGIPDVAHAQHGLDFAGGSSDYVDMGTQSELVITGDLTLEAWIRPDNVSSSQVLINHGANDVSSSTNDNYVFELISGNKLQLRWQYSTTAYNFERTSALSLTAGTWYHVAVVRDDEAEEVIFYLDGVQQGSAHSYSANATGGSSGVFRLGQWANGSDAPYDGRMDEVRVWSVARSAYEIATHKDLSLRGAENGLQGYWRFDEGSGTSIADESGHNNSGTLSGTVDWISADHVSDPTYTTDAFEGNALDFDGSNDYVNVGTHSGLQITGDMTVEAWVKPDALGSETQPFILHTGDHSGAENERDNVLYSLDVTGGKLRAVWEYDGGTNVTTTSTTSLAEDVWQHVAWVRDASAKTVTLYINGVADGLAASYSNNPTGGTSGRLHFGHWLNGPYDYFDGRLDEARIWSVARTAEEIQDNLFSDLSGSETGLVAYYQFNESSGTTASDPIGGYDGTLVNMDDSGDWVTSEMPERSATVTQTINSTGTSSFSAANASFNVTAIGTSTSVNVSRFDSAPSTLPTSPYMDAVYTDHYWAVLLDPAASLTADVTLTLASSTSGYTADLFNLYRRDIGSTGSWTLVGSASSSSGSTVTFSDVSEGGQFIVARFNSIDPVPGTALAFDGVDEYVTLPTDVFTTSGGTIEHWFKKTADTGEHMVLAYFSNGTSSGYNGWGTGTALEIHTGILNNRPSFAFQDGESNSVTGDTELVDGQWYHMAATYAYSGGVLDLHLYLDGRLEASFSEAVTLAGQSVTVGRLGAPGTSARYLYGEVDELRFWDTVRTQEEIQTSMNLVIDSNESGLVASYQFNAGSGSTLFDRVDDNHGTLTNMEDADWVDSGIIVGGGSGAAAALASLGYVDLSEADITMIVTDLPEAQNVVATRYDLEAENQPAWAAIEKVYDDRFWRIVGDGTNTFQADITFTLPETISSYQPLQFKLFQRSDDFADTWTYAGQGAAISGSSITFEGVTGNGQFLIARAEAPDVIAGNALSFGENDAYVEANSLTAELTGDVTLEAWIQPSSISHQAQGAIFGIHTTSRSNILFLMYEPSSGRFRFYQQGDDVYSSASYPAEQVYHVAITLDSSTSIGSVYVDGVLAIEASIGGNITATRTFAIGQEWDGGGPTNEFGGLIDEVRAWNTIRSVDELRASMRGTLVGDDEGLVAYYQFNENAGTGTLPDPIGGHDGTLTGMDTSSDWVASPMPLFPSAYQTVTQTGSYAFTGADVDIDVTTLEGDGALLAALADETPPDAPTAATLATVFDRYWLIDAFDVTSVTTDLHLTVPDLTTTEAGLVKLYHRANETESWTIVGRASAVNGTVATFEGVESFGQFLVAEFNSVTVDAGTMLSFDGGNDYVTLVPEALPLGEGTIEHWFRYEGSDGVLLYFSDGTGSDYDGWGGGTGLEIHTGITGGAVGLHYQDGETKQAVGGTSLVAGNWYHMAATYRYSEGTLDLAVYLDGVLEASLSESVELSSLEPTVGQIGKPSEDEQYFQGKLDELRLWNAVRTQAEIQAAMYAPLTGLEASLVGYWPLNDGGADEFATTAADVAHGHDGSLQNMVSSGSNISPWDPTTAPFAVATVSTQTETPGTVAFGSTGISINYLSQTGAQVTVARVDEAPSSLPSSGTVFDDQYWRFERAGSGLFNAAITFDPNESFTASDVAVPDQIQLYTRATVSDSWTLAATGTDVDTDNGTVTFRDIQSFSHFILVRGDVIDSGTVTASDDLYENRVEIEWSDIPPNASRLKITRDGTLVAFVASDETSYADIGGNPGTTYSYCVAVTDIDDNELTSVCDNGSRLINPPTDAAATDGELDAGVLITWTDNSDVEAEYTLYRDGAELTTVPSNTTSYTDETAVAETTYTYCVEAADANDFTSTQACDDGYRGTILPPVGVAASDGQYPDRVALAWTDQADDEEGYNIYRFDSPTTDISTPGSTFLQLDGNKDYVTFGSMPDFGSFGDQYTIEMRFKSSNVVTYVQYLMAVTDGSSHTLMLRFESDGRLRYLHRSPAGSSGGTSIYYDATDIRDGGWHHVAAVRDGTTMRLYMDGVEVASEVSDQDPIDFGLFGGLGREKPVTGNKYLDGNIDDVRIWSSVRTAAEISAYKDATLVGSETGLEAYWPFDEGSGTTGADVTGNGHTATLHGDTGWDTTPAIIATVAADVTTYEDTGATPGTTHTYCVTTVIGSGESIPVCDEGGIEILAAPTNLAASDDTYDDRIELTWSDPGSTEDGFRIYRRDLSASDSTVLTTTTADMRAYFDRAATAATDYRYCVVAVAFTDSDDDGTDDQEVESEPICDAGRQLHVLAPLNVAATDGAHENQVVVTWENPATTASLMEVYRDGALVKTTAAVNLTFTDLAIPSGDTLTYCIAAVTAGGESSTQTCDTGLRVLEPPTDVAATDEAEEDLVTITWVDESSVESGYNIYRWPEGDATADTLLIGTTSASKATYSDYTGEPGVTYLYRVAAFDAYGESEIVEEAGRRILLAPTEFAATDATSETKITLTWTDNSRVEDGYHIYRKTPSASDSSLIATTEARVTTYTDSLDASLVGQTFAYSIVAFDAYGTSASATDEGSTTLLAPSAFNASDTYTDRVELAWIDQSGMEEGYRVYRGVTESSLSELATLAANSTGYTDATATAGDTYVYCVEAYNSIAATTCSEAQDEGGIPIETTVSTTTAQKLTASDGTREDRFGTTSAIDGDYAIVGATHADDNLGAAYIFQRQSDESWSQVQKLGDDGGTCDLTTRDFAGTAVAIQGDYALVSALNTSTDAGFAMLYELSGGTWTCTRRFEPGEDDISGKFGAAVALNSSYAFVGVGSSTPGKVYIYDLTTGNEVDIIEHPLNKNNSFGGAVSASDDYLLVGASGFDEDIPDAGTVYVYRIDTWTNPIARLIASDQAQNDAFGRNVAISDAYALIGARDDDHSSLSDAGGAYFFDTAEWSGASSSSTPSVFTELTKVTSDTPDANALFGFSVALSTTSALVGAAYEDGTASEVGAAYLYQIDGNGDWVFVEKMTPFDGSTDDHYGWSVARSDEGIALVGARNEDDKGNSAGAIYISTSDIEPIFPPDDVAATDGAFDNRIQLTWGDRTSTESGFRVYRAVNGGTNEVLAEVGANVTSYSDFDAAPGDLYTYCVETLSDLLSPSEQVCDQGWRPANGAISGRVAASSGGGIDGVDVCLAPTPNSALLFDGTGGYAQSPNDQSLDVGGTFTLESWVRYSDTGGSGAGDASIIDKMDPATAVTPFALRTARATTRRDHQLLCERRDVDGTFVTVFSDENLTLNDDAWHHVACVGSQDDSGGTLSLYVDGVLSNIATFTTPLTETVTDTDLYFGRRAESSEHWFGGQLDEVRLWDHARTAEEIVAGMTMPLLGSEEDLLGYWPLDQEGTIMPNFAGSPNHAALVDGAYLSDDASPLDVCAQTDVDGNYTLSGIRYGESTTFTVTPSKDLRQFEPGNKSITLSPESPIQNEVTFVDNSAFTITGLVEYPSPFDSSVCPAEDIEMYLGAPGDDLVFQGTTEQDGVFSVAADIGDRLLEPRLTDTEDTDGDGLVHTFDPAFMTLDVQDNLTEVNFLDRTTRTLTGFVGGNCSTSINPVKIRIFTADGCFSHEIEVDGAFSLDLPPQQYFVQVVELDPPDVLDKADVISFFDALGVQEIDLSVQADTLELIYEAPLNVSITGFPTGQVCSADDKLGVPILTQYGFDEDGNDDTGIYNLVISIEQDYGNGNICPVEEGTITLFDEIADGVAGGQELTLENGQTTYELKAGSPNLLEGLEVDGVDRSYQKPLTVIADVEGRDPVTEIQWAVVKGSKTRTSEFVTLATEAIPLLILRDPPGDGSYSFMSEGTKACSVVSTVFVESASGEQFFKVKGGKDGALGFGVGLGSFVIETNGKEITYESSKEYSFGAETTQDLAWEVCLDITEDFKTSSQENMVGADADVFLGVGFNLIFAEADALTVNETDEVCSVDLSTVVDGGLSANDPFHTTYVYTQHHITNNVIPTIEDLIEQAESAGEDPSVVAADETLPLADARANWYGQLRLNEKEKEEALTQSTEPIVLPNGETLFPTPINNRSFSAAAPYTYTTTESSSFTHNYSLKAFAKKTVGAQGVFKLFGYESSGGLKVSFGLTTSIAYKESDAETKKTGYVLSDNDKGDSFSVDVARDNRYDTYVFGLKSGVTSNPWEPGQEYRGAFDPCEDDEESFGCSLTAAEGYPFSQPRDKPTLSITPPERIGANPNEPALFTVGIGNESESQETRSYTLQNLLSENPYGAILRANGAPLDVGQTYRVEPGAVQNVTLEVERGPLKYDYDSLAVRIYPASEAFSPYADTVFFSVQFDAVCSDISILRPLNPWTRTVDDTGDMEIILHDFFLASPDVIVGNLGVEYRQAGDATWLPIETLTYKAPADLTADELANYPDGLYTNGDGTIVIDIASTSFSTTWTPPTDGAYEMRAYTDCGSDAVLYSEITTGTVDTEAPLVFGKPEPADLVYHLGDNISASFNEDIACSTLVTSGASQNVFLTAPDGDDADTDPDVLDADVVCDGRTFFLAPGSTVDLTDYESQVLTVTLTGGDTGLSDRFGNHLETDGSGNDVAWSFTVNQSGFAFSPRNIEIDVTRGTAATVATALVNGRGQPVTVSLDANLTLSADGQTDVTLAPSQTTGTMVANGSQAITFDIPDDLALGTWTGTLYASGQENGSIALGQAPFTLTANIVCQPPTTWTVDASQFEYSMTVTAQLFVDGVASVDVNDRIVAVVDNEIRGLGYVQEAATDVYRITMLVYSDLGGGELVNFQVWDDDTCTLYEDVTPTLAFVENAAHGTFAQPLTVQAPPVVDEQAIDLASGWTWFSVNTDATSTAVNDVLTDVVATDGDIVKNQSQFAFYDETFGWVGTLTDLVPGPTYLIHLQQSNPLLLSGTASDPTAPITLVEGWNWVGYLPDETLAINDALASITDDADANSLVAGDIIKSQYAFAEYVDASTGWIGSLTELQPGYGYQMNVSAAGTLTYPAPSPANALARVQEERMAAQEVAIQKLARIRPRILKDEVCERCESEPGKIIPTSTGKAESLDEAMPGPNWSIQPTVHAQTMTITVEIWRDGEALVHGGTQLALVDAEGTVRGLGRVEHVKALRKHLAFVVAYGDEEADEELTWQLYDAERDTVYEALGTLVFKANGRVGKVKEPFMLALDTSTALAEVDETQTLPDAFALHAAYPNPFNPATTLRYELPQAEAVQLEVFDMLGRRVAVLVDEQQQAGRYTVRFDAEHLASGVYLYRIQAGGFVQVKQMVLLK